jgi:hypothetical protein
LRGRNTIAGGAAGGIVGANANVITQYVYYHYFHSDPRANVIYLGPEACLVIDLVMGSAIGCLLGLVVWAGLRLRVKAPPG